MRDQYIDVISISSDMTYISNNNPLCTFRNFGFDKEHFKPDPRVTVNYANVTMNRNLRNRDLKLNNRTSC